MPRKQQIKIKSCTSRKWQQWATLTFHKLHCTPKFESGTRWVMAIALLLRLRFMFRNNFSYFSLNCRQFAYDERIIRDKSNNAINNILINLREARNHKVQLSRRGDNKFLRRTDVRGIYSCQSARKKSITRFIVSLISNQQTSHIVPADDFTGIHTVMLFYNILNSFVRLFVFDLWSLNWVGKISYSSTAAIVKILAGRDLDKAKWPICSTILV